MNISDALPMDEQPPPARMLVAEGMSLLRRTFSAFGKLGERGPRGGPKVMVIPGFLGSDRATLGLQRALGKPDLYAEMLRRFVRGQSGVLAELEQDAKIHLTLVYRGTQDVANAFITAQDELIEKLYPTQEEKTDESEVTDPAAENSLESEAASNR